MSIIAPEPAALTHTVLECCFETMNGLGSGFLESVYKNALMVTLAGAGLNACADKPYEVIFKDQKVGLFIPDIIVENSVIIELKCCAHLLPEHHAQLINYLKVTGISTGLLVNFGHRKLQYKRAYHP